jgi:hypothetical protein
MLYSQVNLIVGDVFKLQTDLVNVMDDALDVVKWFNSHSRALGILQAEQADRGEAMLCLILPALTRWTSHYLSARRLLQLRNHLQVIALRRREELRLVAGARREDTEKADRIIGLITQDAFWSRVERYVNSPCNAATVLTSLFSVRDHLEPLAVAANATQADNARLDVVLLTLGNLYRIFSKPKYDIAIRSRIHSSLEKRWSKVDQPVFLLAIIFNPYLRGDCFRDDNPFRTFQPVWALVQEVYQRMFQKPAPPGMRLTFQRYWSRSEKWSDELLDLEGIRTSADALVSELYIQKPLIWLTQLYRTRM